MATNRLRGYGEHGIEVVTVDQSIGCDACNGLALRVCGHCLQLYCPRHEGTRCNSHAVQRVAPQDEEERL